MRIGFYFFTIGPRDSLVDWLHVENFAQAHVKAERALRPGPQSPAAGRGFFISDNKPMNNFEFFRPLCEGLGYKHPTLNLPVSLMLYVAWLVEMICAVILRYNKIVPMQCSAHAGTRAPRPVFIHSYFMTIVPYYDIQATRRLVPSRPHPHTHSL